MDKVKSVLIMVLIVTGVLFVNNLIIMNKITNNIINELERDYVPGPYTPGFDPDKVQPKTN